MLLQTINKLLRIIFTYRINPHEISIINNHKNEKMSKITVKDGTEIYYKDWGTGQPIVFHHGWPLSGDDWDAQMIFFLKKGFRVIAHDRRGHGRSSQTANGHEMDTYAADVAELTKALDLKNAVHVGHSTGGGEVIRYVAKHGKDRVAKAVLISAVTPIMAKTESNQEGIPLSVFDEIRENTATQRVQYFQDFTLPFYGYNREGAKVSQGVRDNWWRQGMMGAITAHYDCIKAFSETDFTEDLKSVDIPVLVMHGEDDQIVPFELTGAKAAKLLKNGKLISYPGFPHGMPTTEAATINADLLAFIKS
jgi:non-heme chloroperoxidase